MNFITEIQGTKWYDGRELATINFKNIESGSCILEDETSILLQRPHAFGIDGKQELKDQEAAVRGMLDILERPERIHIVGVVGKSGPDFDEDYETAVHADYLQTMDDSIGRY